MSYTLKDYPVKRRQPGADYGHAQYVSKVFSNLFFSLLILGATAIGIHKAGAMAYLQDQLSWVILIVAILPFFYIFYFGNVKKLQTMKRSTASLGFYSMSVTLMALGMSNYDSGVIINASVVTAFTFFSMAIIAKSGLVNFRNAGAFFTVILIGIIIAICVNLYALSAVGDLVISALVVVVMACLTIHDIQKLEEEYALAAQTGPTMVNNLALYSAFGILLNIINMLIHIARIMSHRKK